MRYQSRLRAWPTYERKRSSSDGCTGQLAWSWNVCRRSRLLVAHGVIFGLPSVVGWEKPCAADPPENELWSRARWYVYDSDRLMPCGVNPEIVVVTCRVSDRSPDVTL